MISRNANTKAFSVLLSLLWGTSLFAAVPSFSKYVLDSDYYSISMTAASNIGEEVIPLTEVPPTYTEETLPPASDPVPVSYGDTVAVSDPETGTVYYVVVKNNSEIWLNEDGTLGASNPNTFLQINERRIDWYSEPTSPYYSTWADFYATNTWSEGDVLIWHFGNPEQTRTFVWDFEIMRNDQPPNGKWVEIS